MLAGNGVKMLAGRWLIRSAGWDSWEMGLHGEPGGSRAAPTAPTAALSRGEWWVVAALRWVAADELPSFAAAHGMNTAGRSQSFVGLEVRPLIPLEANTLYTATVQGVENASGVPMVGAYSWHFATRGGASVENVMPVETSYYTFGSQRVALRISGDPDRNGLYYIHTDHLGSTSALSYGQGHAQEGEEVPGSRARHLPFGEYRVEPEAGLSDRGFTGHRELGGLGLVHMRARFYVPGLGRFLSADILVPDPTDPQSLNRYSYVLNSPLNFTDPTGHCIPGVNCPGDNPTITVGNRSLSELGQAYQYQGSPGGNHCGPTNLAMVVNLQLADLGIEYRIGRQELGDAMQDASRGFGTAGYRFTVLMPQGLEGATPPWGMVDAHGELGAELDAAGHPSLGEMAWRTGGTKDELIGNVENGVLSTLMLDWETGGTHYVTVVGFDPATDHFLLLDPGTGGDKTALQPVERIVYVEWSWLDENWSRRRWWFGFQNRAIIETPLPSNQSGP